MLIFVTLAVLLIIAVVIYLCSNKYTDTHCNAAVAVSLLGAAILIALAALGMNRAMCDLQREEIQAERDIIVYQMENAPGDFLKQSRISVNEPLYTQIKEFNDKVRTKQYRRRSPWLNWFVPQFWEEIELIDYSGS